MKKNYTKAFTIIETIFAVVILSVITVYFLYSINLITLNKDIVNKETMVLNDIQNTMLKIKDNIYKGQDLFYDVDKSRYSISAYIYGELYHIVVKTTKNNLEKSYEMYVKQKK